MPVSLPMYDLPELRVHTERWWQALHRALGRRGFVNLPERLLRPEDLGGFWRRRDLFLSQCCGHDLVHRLEGQAAVVAVPVYEAPGCGRGTYRSFLVARADDGRDLDTLRRARLAVNAMGSHSGWTALRHLLLAIEGRRPLFWRTTLTGGHRASLKAVAEGRADLAAIDCVTFALIEDVAPEETAGLRIVAAGTKAPALPYITTSRRSAAERAAMREAILDAARDPEAAVAKARLRIKDFVGPEEADYGHIRRMGDEVLR